MDPEVGAQIAPRFMLSECSGFKFGLPPPWVGTGTNDCPVTGSFTNDGNELGAGSVISSAGDGGRNAVANEPRKATSLTGSYLRPIV
jgi:hypothetical protein